MKTMIIFFISLLALASCEIYEDEPTNPAEYMSGRWVFYDYDIVIIGSVSTATYIKNDTVCIDAYNRAYFDKYDVTLKQAFGQTAKDRRFVIGQTVWEFDGYHLYVDFATLNGTLRPTHEPYWVSWDRFLLPDNSTMKVTNYDSGDVTNYTIETNNGGLGVTPPNKMTLLSPNIITNLYSEKGSYDKAVTLRIILKFMR
jgi:hypothetical protein